MKKLLLLLALCIPLFALAQVERMPSLTASYNAAQSGGDGTTWTLTGNFSDASGIYDASGVQVGDIVFFSDGTYTFFLPITEIVSAMHPTLSVKVSKVGITQISSVGSGMKAIFHPTSKGYFPFVSGISNADQQVYNEYLMSLLDNASGGSSCEQSFIQNDHDFAPWTPIYWNGSEYRVANHDSIVPDYIVVDSIDADNFTVASCGSYITDLEDGLYWYNSESPGYSLTQDTIKVPLFLVADGKLTLRPIVGFNLGVSVATDTIRVLGIGQSNMIGRPDTSVTHGVVSWDSTRNEKVLVFNLQNSTWEVATESNCHGTWGDLYGTVSVNNATWQFAKELQRRTGKVVKYVISARGGRALSYWTGNTYPMSGEGEDSLTAHVARAGINSFDVVIWDQGENDIANVSYETQFRNYFLRDIRNRTWFSPYKPIIITGMPVTNANYIPFNERLLKLVDLTDPYLNIAQTDSLALVTNDPFSPGDNVHFTGVALQQLGARYFNAFVNTPKAAKGGLFDLAWRDIVVNAKGNTLQLDSLAGRIDVAADKTFYIEKNEPGWAGRFEPYQYLEYTANGDPRFIMRSFAGNDVDAPGETTQNLGYPRLGSLHFYGYKGGNWRRGASIAVYPDSVWSNLISGMMRFTTIAGGNGFNVGETIMSLSQRGHAMGPGIVKPDNDAAWQVDQTNKATYYFDGANRVYSKFKNTIFGIQDASVYSLIHNPFVDSTFAKGSCRIYGTATQVRFNKAEYAGNGNIETALDVSSRYNSNWASRFTVNPYGYLDLVNVENNGDNPRFYFYNSRGTSESAKTRSQPKDYVGFINFAPYNGSTYHNGAVIGTYIAANSSAGSSRFSQGMFFGIDKSGTSPQISSNWLLALDTARAWVPKNLQVGGLVNGTTACLFVNSLVGGNVGINTVTPTSRLQVAGSVAFQVTTISSATTLGEHTVVFATGASTYLVTLPSASSCAGRKYIIKVNGGAKTISSFLDLTGSASTTLTNNTVLTLVSDGSNWQQL